MAQTQASQAQPLQPGPLCGWQPVHWPQSLGQLRQSLGRAHIPSPHLPGRGRSPAGSSSRSRRAAWHMPLPQLGQGPQSCGQVWQVSPTLLADAVAAGLAGAAVLRAALAVLAHPARRCRCRSPGRGRSLAGSSGSPRPSIARRCRCRSGWQGPQSCGQLWQSSPSQARRRRCRSSRRRSRRTGPGTR